ncbi:MAG: glycosyltransferase [Streptosporangiaceae bacterium]
MLDKPAEFVPAVYVIVAYRNAAGSLTAAVRSAAFQRDINLRVVVVDHDSTDDTPEVIKELSAELGGVIRLNLCSAPGERRTPARPLNHALGVMLHRLNPKQDVTTWFVRLDADDVLAHDDMLARHLRVGCYRPYITSPLIFFDSRRRVAHSWGPVMERRAWDRLSPRDLFAVAHHATAARADLVRQLLATAPLYDETVDTGEDLGATARFYQAVGHSPQLAWASEPLCYKALDGDTISNRLSQVRVWRSFNRLRHAHRLPTGPFIRGAAELALSRMVSEPIARTALQRLTTRNGHFADFPYPIVEQRLRELGVTGLTCYLNLKMKAVAVGSVWPGLRPGRMPVMTEMRHGPGWRGSAGSCTGAWAGAGMRCSRRAMRRCASRTGCTCWRSCRWSRNAAAGTARSMTR